MTKTFLVEQRDSGVTDLVRAKDALAALGKVVRSSRYEGALACNINIRVKTVTHTEPGRA